MHRGPDYELHSTLFGPSIIEKMTKCTGTSNSVLVTKAKGFGRWRLYASFIPAVP